MKIKSDEYEFIFDEQTGSLKINRHGEPWRTETGDGALLALMQRCEELEECLAKCTPYVKHQADWGRSHEKHILDVIARLRGASA